MTQSGLGMTYIFMALSQVAWVHPGFLTYLKQREKVYIHRTIRLLQCRKTFKECGKRAAFLFLASP
ncbi:MAG: hypothetical protein KME16_23950 [Scytolyngbya sp. HA4215-MV1]|jgi:hypothetical protein|nr:hypothetical protein [Scytolyngbya sp. HA4215-MV1]